MATHPSSTTAATTPPSPRPSLATLPTEILEAIFLHLDPQSLVAVARTSKFNKRITTDAPIVWRHLCQTRFRFWDPRRDIAAKYAAPLSGVDWRALFIQRVVIEKDTTALLNQMLGSQQDRILHINEIAEFGYDAKDTLLREMTCPDDAEDVLARRYYANAVLERIQREMAINVWQALSSGQDMSIERALGTYDMFARAGEDVDFDTITGDVISLADGVVAKYPEFNDMSARTKASTLASYLREQGFNGVSDTLYRALRNSFIGLVLRSAAHECLPLVSVAIYCAVANRLGLDARPCGFPGHVLCLVYAPKQQTLDGKYKPTSSDELDYMYLDLFRSSNEVSRQSLKRSLRDLDVPSSQHEEFLTHTDTREMVLRTARNIINSVQTIRETEQLHGTHTSWVDAYPDMDNSFYATIWAFLILGPRDDDLAAGPMRRRQYLPYLLEHFQTHYPWDVTLLEQYVIPLFAELPEGPRLQQFVHSIRNIDSRRKAVKRRESRAAAVRFRVGQLFKHKRYHYEGVITGWDTSCDAGEDWIQNMGVDRLAGGREQAFYHVLVCDKSIRYVAEENIALVAPGVEPSDSLLRLAGRHFKRWDGGAGAFVSNVGDEYPEG
ncbi:Hemimethylated DNA-binding protein YccV like-domain-containing protein [Massariosphaeria phaeospora]|uniref:Hemimethylated DNA-binding protein YccV like-domain-containing protein n=1 Tax=Massariosphaeria phaeospora TaxID=100035 RepID=A0A7C8M9H3_9PLEO|nr:Hemimethylated DNA-binding protein YccV like-domain-containing protein [Massariosphaeria phaeospora]